MTPQFQFNDERDDIEVRFACKAIVPVIAYPLVSEGKKKLKFKKMDKFQSYVSKSLRK